MEKTQPPLNFHPFNKNSIHKYRKTFESPKTKNKNS